MTGLQALIRQSYVSDWISLVYYPLLPKIFSFLFSLPVNSLFIMWNLNFFQVYYYYYISVQECFSKLVGISNMLVPIQVHILRCPISAKGELNCPKSEYDGYNSITHCQYCILFHFFAFESVPCAACCYNDHYSVHYHNVQNQSTIRVSWRIFIFVKLQNFIPYIRIKLVLCERACLLVFFL